MPMVGSEATALDPGKNENRGMGVEAEAGGENQSERARAPPPLPPPVIAMWRVMLDAERSRKRNRLETPTVKTNRVIHLKAAHKGPS